MASRVYYSPFIPTFNGNGLPVANARLYFFYTETTDLAPIFQDAAMTTPMSNPVISDGAARYPNIYLDENITYRVRETGKDGTPLADDIDPYIPGTAVIVAPSLPIISQFLSLIDFIPANLRAAIQNYSSTTPVHEYVQEWLDAMVDGNQAGYIPQGGYVVSDTSTWTKPGDSQAPIICGEGSRASFFCPVELDNAPVLFFDGSSLVPFDHGIHMYLSDFGIQPLGSEDDGWESSGTLTRGIEFVGMLCGVADRLQVKRISGDAIYFPRRSDIDPNPDAYTSQITFRLLHVEWCGGWAIYSPAGFGAHIKLEEPNILTNGKGGVFQSGGLFYSERGTISFNGSAAALADYTADPTTGAELGGGGICFASVDGAVLAARIVGTEIDGNFAYNLWPQNCANLITEQIKSNSGTNAHGGATLRPPSHIKLGYKASQVVLNYRSISDQFRSKYSPGEPNTAVTLYDFDPSAGRIYNHTIINPYIPAADQTSALTKYGVTRPEELVTITEDNRPIRSTPEAMTSTIVVAQNIVSGAPAKIIFEAEVFDPLALYTAASGVFTAASTGFYEVNAMVGANLGAAGTITLQVYAAGAVVATRPIKVADAGDNSYSIYAVVPLVAGQTIEIRAGNSTVGAIAINVGATLNRLTIRKMT